MSGHQLPDGPSVVGVADYEFVVRQSADGLFWRYDLDPRNVHELALPSGVGVHSEADLSACLRQGVSQDDAFPAAPHSATRRPVRAVSIR